MLIAGDGLDAPWDVSDNISQWSGQQDDGEIPKYNSNNTPPSTTTIMSSSSVWVQLYYEGKDDPEGNPVEIEPIPKNVGALAKEVKKEELKKELNHAGLTEIWTG